MAGVKAFKSNEWAHCAPILGVWLGLDCRVVEDEEEAAATATAKAKKQTNLLL